MSKQVLHFGNPANLRLKHDQLLIEIEDRGTITRPLEDIACMVIDHYQVTCSTPLLVRAAELGLVIVWCNGKHLPTAYSSPFVGHTLQNLHHRQQFSAGKPVFKQVWAQLVRGKLKNQALVLDLLGKDSARLHRLAAEVRSGDPDNLEATGARYYWTRLFGHMEGFIRDPDGDFPNNFLNYGYAIVRAATARSLAGAGLCLSLGVFHHNRYDPYALADDCMEPFRPWVDLQVAQMCEEGMGEELDKTSKGALLGILLQTAQLDEKNRSIMGCMDILASSLVQCFAGKTKELKIPLIDV